MSGDEHDGLWVRRTTGDDVPAIVALATRSLGWAGDDRDRRFFEWKHLENPFGESPGWAAFDGERMVAVRMMMRWELQVGGDRYRVVRAVDTATDPDYQGRGLFRRLTMQAVDDLTAEGVDAVFNTPNGQSMPGYLKMGWVELGRPTVKVRIGSVATAIRMVRSDRVGAMKWSLPTSGGVPVDAERLAASALGQRARPTGSIEVLRWRYGLPDLAYRMFEVGGGLVVGRVRERSGLRELAICDWLPSDEARGRLGDLLGDDADYAIAVGAAPKWRGMVPVPRFGPRVTWRTLANPRVPDLDEISFSLGDLELF